MTELESKTLATTLYVSLFRRAPDKGGLDYWTEKLQGGLSLKDAIGYFLDSNEGKSLYGTNTSAPTFVDSLYQNVLNRKSDAGGSEFWQGRLKELGSRNEMVEQFITSIQGSGSTDHQLLQNRVEFGLSFAASKSGDNVSYAKSLLSSITSDPASLNIAKLVNAYLDNPPAPATPATPATPTTPKFLDFMGKNLEADFNSPLTLSEHKAFAVGNGVELTGFGLMDIDVYAGGFILTTPAGLGGTYYPDGVRVKFTDVNNELAAFKGVVVNSSTFTDHAPFKTLGKNNIAVSDDVVMIDLSGVYLSAGESIDFSILG